ncbi:sialin [Tetranychus urticae]|uniref:Major facilitator superfamily (MFS) profile domain-containing protein n=1 Tax=Tetranychus urticae TaxID=32264 RepID=T1JSB6_TETUR|nr:sialin [Tetranychus urticae]
MVQYKDEVSPNRDENLKKPMIAYRYFIMAIIFIATVVVFSVRNVINVAIIAMVDKSSANHSTSARFDWNQHDQGIVLGSYYYTYAPIQIVAGALTDKFDPVHLMIGAQVISTICSFITPYSASMGVFYIAGVRMLMGLVHGVTLPTMYVLIEKWFLPSEIGLAQGLMASGCDFGNAMVTVFAAWISSKSLWGGWPAGFFIMGIINVIFLIVWTVMVSSSPQSNRFVSNYEKNLLKINMHSTDKTQKKKATPWIKLLTSIPLWSIIITKGLIGLAYSVIQTKVPVYLASVLGYDIQNNGLINSLFYIAVALSQLVCGPLSNYIITKGWLSKIITRKLFESIALAGIISSLVTVCYSDDNSHLIIACLILAMFSYGFNLGGDVPIIPEMAPALVGTAFGISNALACASGFIAPALVGAILGDNAGSQSKWILAFQIVAALQLIALLLFGLFATTEPQSWAKFDDEETDPQSVETVDGDVKH